MIIGICGKSGSGKSTLSCKIMDEYKNAIHLDIDKIGHKVLTIKNVQNELIKCFGEQVVDSGIVNRKRLGDIVFNSRKEMSKLSDITWNYMQLEIDNYLIENKNKLIILDWILLPNTKYFDMCDIKILLDIPYGIRKKRAIKRDGIKEEDFFLRDKASINFNNSNFDYILKNNDEEIIKRLVKSL